MDQAILNVSGTDGQIEFNLGSGDALVKAKGRRIKGRSGSGSINLEGILKDVELKTGSGDLTVSYKSTLQKGQLDLKSGSGDLTAYFPPNMKVLSNLKSGSGSIFNELGDFSKASFTVSMKTGSGDLKIKKLR